MAKNFCGNSLAPRIPARIFAPQLLFCFYENDYLHEARSNFSNAVKKQYAITYPIFRVYKYVDHSGQYYCILTEKYDSLAEGPKGKEDTLHYAIRAINLKADSGKLKEVWEINDHAIRDHKIEGIEQSIWFWTRYIEFSDFDGDGLIEPIVIYGSKSDSDISNGRVKFIIYYKGKKVAIRHQNSDLDVGRSTQIDKEFYTLPLELKECIKLKVLAMEKDGNANFGKTKF